MRRALWKLAVVALAALALYTLAGYLLAPRLVRSWVETTGGLHQLVVGEVTADPFTFRVSLIDTALRGPENQLLVSIPRADAVVEPAGIAAWTLKLHQLTLYAPDVKLASIPATGEPQSRLNAGLLRVVELARMLPLPDQVDDLRVVGGRVRFGEPAQARAAVELTDLDLHASNLSTAGAELSPFGLVANVNRASRVEGSGRLGYREGQLRIIGDFTAHGVDIAEPQNRSAGLTVGRLLATGVDIDTSQPAPSVALLRLENPHLRVARPVRGGVSLPHWLEWLANPDSAAPPIRGAELVGGRASFTDRHVTPAVRLEFVEIEGVMQRDSPTAPALEMVIKGRLNPSGAVSLAVVRDPAKPAEATRVDLALRGVELPLLSPYIEAAAGRGIRAGRLDLALRYVGGSDQADLDSRIVVERLRLADQPSPRGGWPLELAIALLEDPSGRIELVLPVRTGPMVADAVPGVLLAALRDRVDELAAAPFEVLARLTGRPDETLGTLPFEPGSTEISPLGASRLAALGKALMARPGLAISVHPTHDPDADRQALAARQVRLHVALATSARPATTQQQSIELDDPKVRGILDEFGSTRLPPATQAAISDRHPDGDGAYYRALFEALVENEAVPDTALERLARYRAQSVVDALLAYGVPAERLTRAEAVETVDTRQAGVLLRLEVYPANGRQPVVTAGPGAVVSDQPPP